jgi:hypothetical protein
VGNRGSRHRHSKQNWNISERVVKLEKQDNSEEKAAIFLEFYLRHNGYQ